jgi:RNA polymerase sigma-70 factor, ECF subfamily
VRLLLLSVSGSRLVAPVPVRVSILDWLLLSIAPVRHTDTTPFVTSAWQADPMAKLHTAGDPGGQHEEIDVVSDFDDLFRDNYANLVRSIGLAIGDPDLAADAVQEAFAKAHVRWHKVSEYSSPIGWVRTVAVNAARDQQRRRQRFDRMRHLIARDERVHDTPEMHTPLTDALSTLSPQQRIAATLFYLDDLSLIDVAKTMRLSEGAVKFHLSQARERLRPLVGERVS